MTMRVKIPNGFRFGFTGTPIDRTLQNTHRDFGPVKDGVQERYLSYYGIRRAIADGATLEVHYIRDKVPFRVDEEALSVGFEEMCAEMELEDEEAKDFVQRQKSRWKELARHPERVQIVSGKIVDHFLSHPDPNGFKGQVVVVDRKACVVMKEALDAKLAGVGLPAELSDVIISDAQNSEPEIAKYEYAKSVQDELIDYFKLTPDGWRSWNRVRFGEDESLWRPPLKLLIVCDRLLTGFDAPVEQVMYLDKPLRDHNLLQAVARTNRPMPAMGKRTGVVVDYFGVLDNLEKALNFDESIREEALIDWDALRSAVPLELQHCMEPFAGISIDASRDCYLAALRRLRDPETAKSFERSFKSLERLWEAVAPDPSLYPYRHQYTWLCGIYVAYRRRSRGATRTYGELAAKTRELIEQHTEFLDVAEDLPVFKIDADYPTKMNALPTPADKAAALEAMLTQELGEGDDGSFAYRQLGERLEKLRARRDASDAAAESRLRELEELANAAVTVKTEPERLGLEPGAEYGVFTVLREFGSADNENYVAECARLMVSHLYAQGLLPPGWSASRGGRMRVEQALLVESWNARYAALGFDPDDPQPPFVDAAVDELAVVDSQE
jgi:type I restriction enzyme R subunit